MITIVYKGSEPNLWGFRTLISCDMVKDGYVLPIAIGAIQMELVKAGRCWNTNTFLLNEYSNPITLFNWRAVQSS